MSRYETIYVALVLASMVAVMAIGAWSDSRKAEAEASAAAIEQAVCAIALKNASSSDSLRVYQVQPKCLAPETKE